MTVIYASELLSKKTLHSVEFTQQQIIIINIIMKRMLLKRPKFKRNFKGTLQFQKRQCSMTEKAMTKVAVGTSQMPKTLLGQKFSVPKSVLGIYEASA